MHHDLESLIESSHNAFLSSLTPENASSQGTQAEEKSPQLLRSQSHQLLGKNSIAARVKSQMEQLATRINECDPYFVRCIKPNASRSAAPAFDRRLVLTQLRFLGLMETCRIRRDGFPVRRAFAALAEEYAEIIPAPPRQRQHDLARCRRLLEAHLGGEGPLLGGWAIGRPVFLGMAA